jgi:hypothetical protein
MKKFTRQENFLKKYLETEFEVRLLKSSFQNLQDFKNDLCFNNFAYSIRELSRHILARLSPDKAVLMATWYKNEIPNKKNGITRAQRIKYAIQGGITDDFVHNELELDLQQLTRRINRAIDLLNKFTHIEADTIGVPPRKISELVNETVVAFEVLFDTIEACRSRIIKKIERAIDESLLNHSIETTFDEIDILSTHSSVDECYISKIEIVQITAQQIYIIVTGKIRVRLQYGSDGDLRDGDGAVFHDSFPFTCELTGDINQLEEFEPNVDSMHVNTKSFYE